MKIKEKMDRRKFLKLSATGAATACTAALLINSGRLFTGTNTLEHNSVTVPQNAKKTFSKKGACSHTFLYLLNREFGYPKENEERASDPLAGGLMMTQNQCGMLWGATLAVGAESFRRYKNRDQAIAAAITATQHIVESFSNRAKSLNCRDIIDCDISDNFDIMKFMLKSLPGGFTNMVCMNLAEKWAPEAVQSAKEGLSDKQTDLPQLPVSCASEVAKKMGDCDEEMVMVAGCAGGIGLSGNACGALGAAIWTSSFAWCRKHPGESGYSNPKTKEILKAFYGATGSEILCTKISRQRFKTIDDHTKFIKNGGCDKLINILARA
jgi:hypothetical protein